MGGTYQQILMQNSKTFPKETSLQPPNNRGSEHRRGVTPHLPVSAIPPCAALVLNVTLVYLRPNQRFTSGFCARRATAQSPSASRSAQRLPWTVGDGQLRLLRFSCCAAPTAGVTGEPSPHRQPMECLCVRFFHSRANVELFTI